MIAPREQARAMTDWLQLDCPFCRCRFRIKAAYAHLKGRCPECAFRIAAPTPREAPPAPISDSDEPLGLLPLDDEEWPEPGLRFQEDADGASYVLSQEAASAPAMPANSAPSAASWEHRRNEASLHLPAEMTVGIYGFAAEPKPTGSVPVARPLPNVDAESSGVYAIAEAAEAEAGKAFPTRGDTAAEEIGGGKPAPQGWTESKAAASVLAMPIAPPPAAPAVDPLFLDVIASAPIQAAPSPVASPAAAASSVAPEPAGAAKPRKRKKKAGAAPTAEERVAPAQGSNVKHAYKLSNAELNPEREEPLPDDVFLTGVWGFPLKPRNLAAWFWLSFGATLIYVIAAFIVLLLGAGQLGVVAAGFLGLGGIWVIALTGSYAGAALLGLVADTANGADEVVWPEGGWKEWFFSFLHVAWLEALACAAAAPFWWLTGRAYGDFAFLIAEAVVFPLLLVAALASEWSWLPFNGRIFGTVATRAKYWVCLWFLVALVNVPLYVLYLSGAPWWCAPLFGIAFGYAWIVRGRLIGRLGRLLMELDEPGRKKRKSRKRRPGNLAAGGGGWGGVDEGHESEQAAAKPPTAQFAADD